MKFFILIAMIIGTNGSAFATDVREATYGTGTIFCVSNNQEIAVHVAAINNQATIEVTYLGKGFSSSNIGESYTFEREDKEGTEFKSEVVSFKALRNPSGLNYIGDLNVFDIDGKLETLPAKCYKMPGLVQLIRP